MLFYDQTIIQIKGEHTMDFSTYYSGQNLDTYQYFGVHPDGDGFVFRTYAPNAVNVALIGEFNDWKEQQMLHSPIQHEVWEISVPEAKKGQVYKYRIYRQDGRFIDHCDPYGFQMEVRPAWGSVIYDLADLPATIPFTHPGVNACWNQPLNIYEMHMGSWKMKSTKDNDWYEYDEIARQLVPYLKEQGYNYVEVMPLAEYPSDQSWGYQSTGFFSATSRYGKPEQLKQFVNLLHENGIGVIMDFVPVHFAVDDYALWNYDGTEVYEYDYADVSHSEWGTNNFNHGKGEVSSFLTSAGYFWLKEYGFDGLRLDAVSNLIYWQGNKGRGVNDKTVRFIQNFNSNIKSRIPSAIMIAEDSSDYPGVTRPVWEGGLGFDYKWDLGFMNDTLTYFKASPEERKGLYHKLTFSMMYFYNEKFILPLSHDEVVHGKATILQKMNGGYERKFSQARSLYMYIYAHPGKKLNFMGTEFGQLREWDEKREQDWFMLKYPNHDAFHHFMKDLCDIYQKNDAFYAYDYELKGFEWRDCNAPDRCTYVFERRSDTQRILAVFNFSDYRQEFYHVNIPEAESLTLLMDSNRDIYGGEQIIDMEHPDNTLPVTDGDVMFFIEPFSARYYRINPIKKKKFRDAAKSISKKDSGKTPEKTSEKKSKVKNV